MVPRMMRLSGMLCLMAAVLPLEAASIRSSARRSQTATSLNARRRLVTNEPTVEHSFSVDATQSAGPDDSWLSPVTVTYQASAQLDFSLSFDAFERRVRTTQASSYWTATAARRLKSVRGVDFSVMPQVTMLTRDARGLRAGATLLASGRLRGNALGVSANWTGATSPSPDNPAGLAEMGAGYGRQLKRFLLHGNFTAERGSSLPWFTTMLEGVQVRLNGNWALDLSAKHAGLSAAVEHRVLVTLSWTSAARKP